MSVVVTTEIRCDTCHAIAGDQVISIRVMGGKVRRQGVIILRVPNGAC